MRLKKLKDLVECSKLAANKLASERYGAVSAIGQRIFRCFDGVDGGRTEEFSLALAHLCDLPNPNFNPGLSLHLLIVLCSFAFQL